MLTPPAARGLGDLFAGVLLDAVFLDEGFDRLNCLHRIGGERVFVDEGVAFALLALLLLPPGVERRTGNTKAVTDTGHAIGSAGARGDRGGHYRALRRAKGPTCPTRVRNTSFSIVSSPIRFIAAASSSLTASPSRSRNAPSIPDSARSCQRSSRYSGTPSSRDRLSVDSPRSRRRTTSRLRPTLQRCPGARPPGGIAGPVESVDGRCPPSLPTGAKTATDGSSKTSLMSLFPSRFH